MKIICTPPKGAWGSGPFRRRNLIHAVQQVRPHHGDLVDDDGGQLPVEIVLCP